MRDTILEILEELRPDVDFENETKLIDDKILESFDIVSLVSELTDEFDITIRPNNRLYMESCTWISTPLSKVRQII